MCKSGLLPLARAALCAEWLHLSRNAPGVAGGVGIGGVGCPAKVAVLEILAGLLQRLLHVCVDSPAAAAAAAAATSGAAAVPTRKNEALVLAMLLALIDTAQDAASAAHPANAVCAALTVAAATLVLAIYQPARTFDAAREGSSSGDGEEDLVKKEARERVIGLVEGIEVVMPQLQKSEDYWLLKLRLALLSQPAAEEGGGSGGSRGGQKSNMAEEDDEAPDAVCTMAEEACAELPESSALLHWRLARVPEIAARISSEARGLGVCL